MKKVFISIPMANKSNEEIKDEIRVRTTALECLGFEVADSFIEDKIETTKHIGLQYLGYSLITLSDCDIAYFCKGWNNARGCKIEYDAALSYGLEIVTED